MYPKVAKKIDTNFKRRVTVKYGNSIVMNIDEMYTITNEDSDVFKVRKFWKVKLIKLTIVFYFPDIRWV